MFTLHHSKITVYTLVSRHIMKHYYRAESVNSFKSRLDKLWQHRELMYNYRSELHGTGSQSEFNW